MRSLRSGSWNLFHSRHSLYPAQSMKGHVMSELNGLKETVLRETELMAQPIEFRHLIAEGLFEQVSAERYRLLAEPGRLPEHVRKKIKSITSDGIVSFWGHGRAEKLLKKWGRGVD